MECLPADARGPQRLGLVGRLLTRLDPARVGVSRPHSQDLGCKERRVLVDAQYWQDTLERFIRYHWLIPSH
jgi:hypothetical protein